jgi:hypothetical protein
MGIIAASRVREYPVTDRLKGCNSLLSTKALLATQLTVSESNIINLKYDNDNNQMTWHSVNNYQITESRRFSSLTGEGSSQLQIDLAGVVTEFESSKITDADIFFFSESNIRVLKMSSFTDIQNEGLRDLKLIETLELDSLVSFNNSSLINLANNAASPVSLDFPNLTTFGQIGDIYGPITGRFTFVQTSFSLTNADGSIFLRNWSSQQTLPFAQSKLKGGNVGDSLFRFMTVFNEDLDLPQITSLGELCFQDNFQLESIKLINVTSIGGYFLRNANAMLFIDIRRCTTLDTNSLTTITNLPENGTINANIALQDYNGNGLHPRLAYLLTRNWTINYFDI